MNMTRNMITKAPRVNRIPQEGTYRQAVREGLVQRTVGGTLRKADNEIEEAGRKQRGEISREAAVGASPAE